MMPSHELPSVETYVIYELQWESKVIVVDDVKVFPFFYVTSSTTLTF